MPALKSARRGLVPVLLLVALLPALASPASAAPGDLDLSFGNGGSNRTPIGSGKDEANGVALQTDGKIVAAGSSYNGFNDDFAVVRYTTSGALDTTFGTGGKVTTPFGSGADVATAVAIQSDGKIVAAGYTAGAQLSFALARYTTSGALDTTFGTGGKVTTSIGSGPDQINALAIQADGKIVVAGSSYNGTNLDFAVARYTTSGALDSTFGSGGKATTLIGFGHDEANAVAIQSDGKIVLAGYTEGPSDSDFAIARYTAAGTLDSTFGPTGSGRVTTAVGIGSDIAEAIAIQPDGRIVVAGEAQTTVSDGLDFTLVRYSTYGSLDSGFGSGGKVTTPIGSYDDVADAVAIQPDGKLVAVGRTYGGSYFDFALARYAASGALDSTFGSGGKTTSDFGQADEAHAMALQPDGKIVVAGISAYDFQVARYLADPPTISIGDASVVEGDSGTTNLNFTVSLAGAGSSDLVQVQYATADGTAVAGSDYVAKSGWLQFNPGQVTKTISITVKGDLIDEPNETFFVRLSSATGATIDNGTATGTILDNDPTPTITAVDAGTYESDSGAHGLSFTVALSNPSSDYVSVDFTTADGTATSASGDYQARSGTRVFRPGQTAKTISIQVNGDTAQENDETFFLNLYDPDGAVFGDSQAVGRIDDEDSPSISIDDQSKTEPASGSTTTMTFHVTLSKAGTNTITVNYLTQDDTAIAGEDYVAKSGTLTFAPGTLTKTIAITIKHDNQVGNEDFYVYLSNPNFAHLARTPGLGTIIG